jgi:hypothetical protein
VACVEVVAAGLAAGAFTAGVVVVKTAAVAVASAAVAMPVWGAGRFPGAVAVSVVAA